MWIGACATSPKGGWLPSTRTSCKEPDQKILLNLIEALVSKVAKGPSEPRQLTPQQLREIRDRVRIGEDKHAVAHYYGVDVAVIRQLAS